MRTTEQLREQRAAIWDQMEAIEARAVAESRDITPAERSEYDQLEATYNEVGASIDHAKRRASNRQAANSVERPSAGEPVFANQDRRPGSLGEHFASEVGERLVAVRDGESKWSVSTSEFRNAATDVQVTGGNTGALGPLLTDIDTTIVPANRRQLTVVDLLSHGVISGSAITYFVEGALEGDFATVAEGGTKPQLHYLNPTPIIEALKKIAGFIKESDEMIEDLPFLVSAINNRLLYNLDLFEENQVLNGNGTGTNLRGLLQRSGIQSLGATTDAKAGNADQVFKAKTAVFTATGLRADGIIINPLDYQDFRLSKDDNKQYYGGGFFSGQYGNGVIEEEPPLWGLRTVVTPAIAAGTVAVGAFKQAATLYTKGGIRVEATNSDQDDFINNRVTIRAEKRDALAVRVPSAIVKLTLGQA